MDELECFSCDAVFTVDHDLDDDYYKVKHCPFCGSKVTEEDDDVTWDDADWEE
jgi:rRNA maturation endonuclease Nob1